MPSETHDASGAVEPFRLEIGQEVLDDLRRRLQAVRWPDAETVDGWRQGVPLEDMRRLHAYWLDRYDWRRCEAVLNGLGQHRTEIDGLGIHFLHVRSPEPDALPLVLTHGWPGSIMEFVKVIGPLTDPAAHGGDPRNAFHVVIPSLPGYGFSDRPTEPGWTIGRIARAWIALMRRLGYSRYVAQGGDWGAGVTLEMGAAAPPELLAVHVNLAFGSPSADELPTLDEEDKRRLADMARHRTEGRGYSEQQSTRPQTLGYALADSPIGQAAWIYEKYREWSDCDGDPTNSFTLDEMLDNIMLYWLPNAAASSARLYWHSLAQIAAGRAATPVGVSLFPKEIYRPARRWTERAFPTLFYWNEVARGGHFAAFEVPDLFVEEVRKCFARFRAPVVSA
jgi:pimeloyl-ACP methyl ester carboxylesterase